MASEVEIANLGLAILGEPPIISFADDIKSARVMDLLFISSRDALLRAHPWNFAVKRQVLAQSTTIPAFGFARIYALPADFLRLLRLNDSRDAYSIEADGLLTNAAVANVRYVARVEDTARFDPLFVQTFAAFLAAEAAMPITNSQSIEARATDKFREKLAEARSADGMENYPETFIADHFIEAFLGDEELFRGISSVE